MQRQAHKQSTLKRGKGRVNVYERLRHDILSLELEPGLFLDEVEMSKVYGVSRTPMREALIRLSAEGLVQMRKNSAARVAPMDIKDLREYHEAIEVHHRMVARWAAARRSEEDLKRIDDCQCAFENAARQGDWIAMLGHNVDFHAAIGAAARNRYVQEQYLRLLTEGQRYAQVSFSSPFMAKEEQEKNWQRIVDDHRAIMSALQAKDIEEADRLSLIHSEHGRVRFIKILTQSGASEIPFPAPFEPAADKNAD